MSYKVVNEFRDSKDGHRLYNVGDEYPQGPHEPDKKRIEELSKKHPKYGVVFIEEVKKKSKKKE